MTTSTTSTGWTRSPTSSRSRLAIPILTCAGTWSTGRKCTGSRSSGRHPLRQPFDTVPTAPTHRGRSPARLDVRGVALVSRMPGRVSVKLTLGASSGDGDEQRGQRQRLRSHDAPRSTHGLTTASHHRFSRTFAAAPTTTTPRSRTDSVSALSPTLVPSLINQGCPEIGRGALLDHDERRASKRRRAGANSAQSPKPCPQQLKTPQRPSPRADQLPPRPGRTDAFDGHAEPAADLSVRDRRIE